MSYFESRAPVDFADFNKIENILNLCNQLGLKNIIFEPKNYIEEIPFEIREKIFNESKINVYYRINLRVKDVEDFKNKIKNHNDFKEIISVESSDKEVQLQSARDSRVNIVSFSDPEIIKTLTPGVISLTKQNNSFIEFSMAPLMVKNKAIQSKNFRSLYRFALLAIKMKANCIISGNFIDLYDYRHPRCLISICNSLLGIPINLAKKAFKENPQTLIERTRTSNGKSFEDGVNLI
ncbi:MAG: RNase P subunit p30 family protein [Candidatus Heimdallarchaeota archaeon]